MTSKFYKCTICGNIIEKIYDSGINTICCGKEMTLLVPNTTDGAQEKHVPDCKREGNTLTVQIGSAPHPMIEEHYIMWIAVEQDGFMQRKALHPNEEPVRVFTINDGPATVYEYCNLHGLWAAKVD
ncbi:desulfoferrodoxin Dfx [Eubacteriales bacterium OttesenSCG-928-N14]|nr:desulfoferrodoxin Dfx [Eubacteriales bacterium OttesenSCG-928-N14]